MVVSIPQRRSTRRRGQRLAFRLDLEALETRTVPSVTSWPGLLNPVAETEPNDTLDRSQNLGDLTTTPRAEVIGTISNDLSGGGVDWYSFQLDRAAHVSLTTPKASSNSQPVTALSLYSTDRFDTNDPYNVMGYRLLEQADSALQGGTAQIDRSLAAGTYYVAVSGSGNHYFYPFLADSGYAGATGDYGLLLTATDLGLSSSDGPVVLAADPGPGASIDRSPFLIRVDFSEPLDPASVSAVQLISNATGTFGDGTDQVVSLASTLLNTDGTELMIAPAAPLGPGYYKVVLPGDSSANPQVVADLAGLSLGTNASHATGADFSYTFQVSGNEGNSTAPVADDSAATSHDLGDLSQSGFAQVAAALGTDSTDPVPFDGSDVDVYHFKVTGSGRYAFTAEVFAGRIGSPLGAALSLFQADPTTGQLTMLGSDTGTNNNVQATDQTLPLYTDPALYAGLQAGDYYVVVSSTFNVPNPATSPLANNGTFAPNVSLTGQSGGSTGDYVLNVQVQPGPGSAPQVVAVTPSDSTTLSSPPTYITVGFNEDVNLLQLAQTPVNNVQGTLAAVYVEASNGTRYYPRLRNYDATTHEATFLMLDGLANDTYALHLSGLTDLAGDALVGNDPSGDYVVQWTVNGPARGTGTNPLLWSDQEPNDDIAHAQALGALFWNELQTGVVLQRDFTLNPLNAPADTADYYQFQVLETKAYTVNFINASLPAGVGASLFDASGNPVQVGGQTTGAGFNVFLTAGTYVLKVGDWTTCQAAGVTYDIAINLGANPDNPVPLTAGPAPAISIQLVTSGPLSSPPAPVVVTPPPSASPTVVSTPPPAPSNPPTGCAPPVCQSNNPPTASASPSVVAIPTAPLTPVSPSAAPIGVAPTPAPTFGSSTATTGLPVVSALPAAVVAPPSGSTMTLVNLTAPASANNAGIAPVLLHGPRPTEAVSLPSGVLLALGAAPVGALRESTMTSSPPPADHANVRLPELSGLRSSPSGAGAITRVDSGTSEVDASSTADSPVFEATGSTAARLVPRTRTPGILETRPSRVTTLLLMSRGLHQLANSAYANASDALFGMAQWLEEAARQAPKSSYLSEELPPQDETGDFQGWDSTTLPETTQAPTVSDRMAINGLTALAMFAVARPEKKRERKSMVAG